MRHIKADEKILFLAFVALAFYSCSYNELFRNNIRWEEISELPPAPGLDVQHGLACHYAGVSGDVIIVAGGANFPDKAVYEDGSLTYSLQVMKSRQLKVYGCTVFFNINSISTAFVTDFYRKIAPGKSDKTNLEYIRILKL